MTTPETLPSSTPSPAGAPLRLWNLTAILGSFLLFLAVFLPHTRYYPYYIDDDFKFREAMEIGRNPWSAWAPDDVDRRRPIPHYLLYLESRVFGFNAVPYFVILLSLHLCNALLVGRLCRLLGGTKTVQTLSALLFLCSSAAYQVPIFITGNLRILSLAFFLLATTQWLRYLSVSKTRCLIRSLIFLSLSLLCNEDGLIFPLIAFLLACPSSTRNKRPFKNFLGPLLALLIFDTASLYLLTSSFFASGKHITPLEGSFHPIQTLLSLSKTMVVPLLIPPRNFLSALPVYDGILRLVPAGIVFAVGTALMAKIAGLRNFRTSPTSPIVPIGIGWIAITVTPFLLSPLALEHTSRYLYYPMVGFCLLTGTVSAGWIEKIRAVLPRAFIFFCLPVIVYSLCLNVISIVYHYQRYVVWATETKRDYYPEVRKTLEGISVQKKSPSRQYSAGTGS